MHTTFRAALLVLSLALFASGAAAATKPAAAAAKLPPTVALAPVLQPPADVPQAALDAQLKGTVTLLAHVTRPGYVDSVRVLSGDARLRETATAVARWCVYAPQAAPVWTTLTVTVDGKVEPEPLNPDVLAIAREAEGAKDWNNALAAWTGALQRLGTHPSLTNEWALREHALRTSRQLHPVPQAPGDTQGNARGARTQQERVVARGQHEDVVGIFDTVLKTAPWWSDPYLWRASSLAGCGRSAEAVRSLRFYLLGAPDSAGTWLATTALAQIAAGDTLGASELIKKRAQSFNVDKPGR
ncbi:MAG: hypothetical protein HZA61_01555 [Candidatus Eisenbacteria bacterium]|uniref:Tetratricopeptide repeat protein n=1 Tax=Eiseniibacteriota bacterium TaxID=2212470 RepID=A0A933S8Z6_UNCEI|nr:hypothetical protein [Candidatus Eisenbacteria bacterium]